MNRVLITSIPLVVLLSVASAQTTGAEAFSRLKKLAGTWDGTASGEKIKVVYKVTGGGSALIETQFPDTEHEMVSVYFVDGKNLMLTHYCAAKNQPTMKFLPGKDTKTLRFDFVSGTSMGPKDAHIHNVKYTFFDEDHFVSEWGMHVNGKAGGNEKFDLHRVKA